MKKTIFILIIVSAACCPQSMKAQEAVLKSQRDSLQAMYYEALTLLDSLAGKNMDLSKELEKCNAQLSALKKDVNRLSKEKNETATALASAKKIITDQNTTINKLEAEIKRLSQPKKQ
jgi:peptidoglycan hydrolase CwlO-like protein